MFDCRCIPMSSVVPVNDSVDCTQNRCLAIRKYDVPIWKVVELNARALVGHMVS